MVIIAPEIKDLIKDKTEMKIVVIIEVIIVETIKMVILIVMLEVLNHYLEQIKKLDMKKKSLKKDNKEQLLNSQK